MIIERNAEGTFDVEVLAWQRDLLANLLDPMRDLLVEGSSPMLRRLFPPAYPGDAEADEAYQALVHDQLLEQRLAALDTVERSMSASMLTEEELSEWMMAINSLRLVIGTRLDVTEDDDPIEIDDSDPDRDLWLSYSLLSQMLALIVDALSGPG